MLWELGVHYATKNPGRAMAIGALTLGGLALVDHAVAYFYHQSIVSSGSCAYGFAISLSLDVWRRFLSATHPLSSVMFRHMSPIGKRAERPLTVFIRLIAYAATTIACLFSMVFLRFAQRVKCDKASRLAT